MTDEKKTPEVPATPPAAATPATTPVVPPTEAELIWNEIKNKEIMMFSLPGQRIFNYCRPMPIDPTRCFLLYKAGSAVPAIEAAIGDKYTCEAVDKYVIVSRKKPNAF